MPEENSRSNWVLDFEKKAKIDSESYHVETNYQLSDMDQFVLKHFEQLLKIKMQRDRTQIMIQTFDLLRKLNRDMPGSFLWQNFELILRLGSNTFNQKHQQSRTILEKLLSNFEQF